MTSSRAMSRSVGPIRVLLVTALAGVLAAILSACQADGRDLGVSATDLGGWLAPGEVRLVTVTVANHGSSPADGAAALLATSESLTPHAVNRTGCESSTGLGLMLIRCPLGTVAAGASQSVTFAVTGGVTGTVHNLLAMATSDGGEPALDLNPNSVEEQVVVGTGGLVDLEVTAPPVQPWLVGSPVVSRTVVANRGQSAASQVVVRQDFPTGVNATSATLTRADGAAAGSCSITAGEVECNTGSALINPLTHPDQKWFMDITLVQPAEASFMVNHSASSPHPQPTPDPSPDSVSRTVLPFTLGYLTFNSLGLMEAGTEAQVQVTWVGGLQYAQYVNVSLPAGFEILALSVGGYPVSCTALPARTCSSMLVWPGASSATITIRATGPTDAVWGSISYSSEAGGVGGSFALQAVDPSVTSDVHPTLLAPVDGVVGEQITASGIVHNAGSTDHQAVIATVDASGAILEQVVWGDDDIPCSVIGSTGVCDIGDLDAHDSVPLRVTLVGQTDGAQSVRVEVVSQTPQQSPDPHSDVVEVSFPMLARVVDLGVEAVVTPVPPTLDVPLRLEVTVTNHGTVTSAPATLVVSLPSSLPSSSALAVPPLSPGGGTCTVSPQSISCPLGTLARGRSQVIRVTANVPSLTGGTVEIDVSSADTEPTQDPHINELAIPITVSEPQANLNGTLKTLTTYVSGEEFEIEGRAFNFGPSAVTDAVATVSLPADWTLTSAVTTSGTLCTVGVGLVTCPIGSLHGSGGNRRFTLRGTAGGPATNGQAAITVSSSLPDPQPADTTTTYDFTVLPREVDLGLDATVPSEVVAGTEVTMSIRITNGGPAYATTTTLTGTFPSDMEIISAWPSLATSGSSCSVSGQTVTCVYPKVYATTSSGPWANIKVRYLQYGTPTVTQFAVTSDQPERPDAALPNSLSVERTPHQV